MSLNLLREVDLEDPADAKAMVGSFFVGRRHHGGQRSDGAAQHKSVEARLWASARNSHDRNSGCRSV
jgi:hypothetical protein